MHQSPLALDDAPEMVLVVMRGHERVNLCHTRLLHDVPDPRPVAILAAVNQECLAVRHHDESRVRLFDINVENPQGLSSGWSRGTQEQAAQQERKQARR